jgi:hypothetical protein
VLQLQECQGPELSEKCFGMLSLTINGVSRKLGCNAAAQRSRAFRFLRNASPSNRLQSLLGPSPEEQREFDTLWQVCFVHVVMQYQLICSCFERRNAPLFPHRAEFARELELSKEAGNAIALQAREVRCLPALLLCLVVNCWHMTARRVAWCAMPAS